MQKLITIYFDDTKRADTGVQEHLRTEFQDGWKVIQMVPVGSSVGSGGDVSHSEEGKAKGWLAVLLEK